LRIEDISVLDSSKSDSPLIDQQQPALFIKFVENTITIINNSHRTKSMKTVLITGGSGFIGSHLINSLKKFKVVIFERTKPSHNVTFIKGDITNKSDIENAISEVDFPDTAFGKPVRTALAGINDLLLTTFFVLEGS